MRLFLYALLFAPLLPLRAQDTPAPVVGKSVDNMATGSLQGWDFSGTDLTMKATLNEVWVVDAYSQAAPFINAFSLSDLSAPPRRMTIQLPPELGGATVLGLAEIPRGDFQGKNLVLVDPAFGYPNEPSPLFGVLEDDGTPLAGGSFFPPSGVDPGARLGAIDINPQREEIAAYDITTHSFYLLDFNFSAIAGPIPLLGSPSFFSSPWLFGTDLEGNGGGLAYLGPDLLLAPAALVNSFDAYLIVEYDLRQGGIPTGRAIDLSAASAGGAGPDLAFGGIDTGSADAGDVLLALNSADDSLYSFGLVSTSGPEPVRSMVCRVRDTGHYEVSWSIDDPAAVDAVQVHENGIVVATVDPSARFYLSPLPLLGNGFIELSTEKAGAVSPVRTICQLQDSRIPDLEGVQTDSVIFGALGDLAGVAVTKTPATLKDFRGYLLGLNSNLVAVFDHRLDILETFQPNPTVRIQGRNLAAIGVALIRLDDLDHLAVLDPDGPLGRGPPSAIIHILQGARRGQLRQRIDALDLSQLSPIPTLTGWDSDRDGNFVAGGVLPLTQQFVLVRIRFDGKKMWASRMVPAPQHALTPFIDQRLVGLAVTVLPSGNLLVAGSDTFARTYTEALLLTPLDDDPGRSPLLVGYAQGLPIPEHILSAYGIGKGPPSINGLAVAHFPSTTQGKDGVGVTYLPAGNLILIRNAAGIQLYTNADYLVHGENRCSNPNLEAEQLDDEALEAPPGGSLETRRLSPTFQGRAASIDFYYYVFNQSTTDSVKLTVETSLGGVPVAEGGASILMPPGRYFRRALTGRSEKDLRVRLKIESNEPVGLRIVVGATAITTGPPASPFLKRGDCDWDGSVQLNDAIFGLSYQFLSGPRPVCPDACDADDSGFLDLSDMVWILSYLFSAGPEPSPPGPQVCGPDTTTDALDACTPGAAVCQ